jgi:hypothetical protein
VRVNWSLEMPNVWGDGRGVESVPDSRPELKNEYRGVSHGSTIVDRRGRVSRAAEACSDTAGLTAAGLFAVEACSERREPAETDAARERCDEVWEQWE